MRCPLGVIPAPANRMVNIVLRDAIRLVDTQLCRVDARDVTLGNLVQRGMQGSVFRGTFRGEPVAVKQFFIAAGGEGLTAQQLREIEIVKRLLNSNLSRCFF